jgi:transcriptional regulator with XRE-family HTH domain
LNNFARNMCLAQLLLTYNRDSTGGTGMINRVGIFKFLVAPAPALSASKVPHSSIPPILEHAGTNLNKGPVIIESDRDVIRCITCGMVQYRTRNGNCRRCLHLLTPKVEFLFPPPETQEIPRDERQLIEKWPNREMVENIGQRIRQLRESRGMTQSRLQARSRVSRSYLSRIESGQMTPSIGTLEKISEALGIGLNRFFVPEANGEALLEDPFIQGLRPFLRQLDWAQWQSILKRLAAISDHVSSGNGRMRPLAQPQPDRVEQLVRRIHPAAMGHF